MMMTKIVIVIANITKNIIKSTINQKINKNIFTLKKSVLYCTTQARTNGECGHFITL
jgi:hypothetical protein